MGKDTNNEKVRVNEIGPEDETFEDPELREMVNEIIRAINRSHERLERFHEGEISNAEMGKLQREDEKLTRELNRKLKDYKKRRGA